MRKTLIVVDTDFIELSQTQQSVISFQTYLEEYPKRNEPKTRIINLCDTEHYLSRGYYCSLLAEARQHKVLPSVKTINHMRRATDDPDELSRTLLPFWENRETLPETYSCMIYFGQSDQADSAAIAKRVFQQFPCPVIKLTMSTENGHSHLALERIAFSALDTQQREACEAALQEFMSTAWRVGQRTKSYRWDMAILVNNQEKVPPSNREAITRFIKAAEKNGIHAEAVDHHQLTHISQYDALFIRETTAIDHHTYRLACKAEEKGLVVMDDPASILRCCNKVFLHDAFNYQHVPSLRTQVLTSHTEETLDQLELSFGYPLVLKMPEGSFSKGVYKVKDRDELNEKLNTLFAKSALVLAQEYLYTDFDWRVGILNDRAIYACRYEMARNHWQIYNHDAKRFFSGGFETLPTFEVPKAVLEASLKAAKVAGSGLYGVDVKEIGGKAYVLEVNDNPSIDHKVEDAYLGNELYMQIMAEFLRRLEARGR